MKKGVLRTIIGIFFSISFLGVGILSLRHFLGFDLGADAAIEEAVEGEVLSYLLPIPLPDFTIIQ